jgi:hypothetical protein
MEAVPSVRILPRTTRTEERMTKQQPVSAAAEGGVVAPEDEALELVEA